MQPEYTLTANGVTGPLTNLGAPQAIPAAWLSNPASALAVGIISTTGGASSFPATYNFIEVTPPPPPPATETPFGGTAAAVPGVIEAENYDLGGQGLAYNAVGATNNGGTYRPGDGVGIVAAQDASGNFAVGYTRAGDFLNYSVNVAAAGAYNVGVRVATASAGGTFHLEFNGVNVTGPVALPNTGGWANWQTVTVPNVQLAAGPQVMKLVFDAAASAGDIGNVNYVSVAPAAAAASQPFGGTPAAAPGTILADNYDLGGEGVGYHTQTAVNPGGQYRADGVSVETTTDAGGNGFDVGRNQVGNWLDYTVNVAAAGSYVLQTRVASATGGTFHYSLDGAALGGAVTLPNTGGWQTWQTVPSAPVALPAGTHVLRLTIDAAAVAGQDVGNFNYIQVQAASTTQPFGGTPVALPGTVVADNYDLGGEGVGYHTFTAVNPGGQYRADGVGIEATADAGGNGFDVGYNKPGEWLNYSVGVAAAGSYVIQTRVASGTGGTFHYNLDGATLSAPITLPNTGGWQTWQTVASAPVTLAAGTHVLQLFIDTAAVAGQDVGNFNYIQVQSAAASQPFGGAAAAAPGVVPAANFDTGGEGQGYHLVDGPYPSAYRPTDAVYIETATDSVGNGYDVGRTRAGDWLQYTINVATAGSYTLAPRVASAFAGGTFHLGVDGANVPGTLTIPDTGGWQAYQNIVSQPVSLTAGPHVMRLTFDSVGPSGSAGNVDAITIAPVVVPPAVNAGTNQIVAQGATVTLGGTASSTSTPLTTLWSLLSGPGTVQFANAASVSTTATFTAAGVYQLQLTATAGGVTSTSPVTISVDAPPTVSAGANQEVNFPTAASLQGSVTNVALPGDTFTATWSQVSGPGTTTFGNAGALSTTATFSASGVYVLKLAASDGTVQASGTTTVSVNVPPVVSAGGNQTVNFPQPLALAGTVADNDLPNETVTSLWTQVSGPGTATFAKASSPATSVTFSASGVYVLKLTASDGFASTSGTATVRVNLPPVVSAGANQAVTLPNSATLAGTVTDNELPGETVTSAWSTVSGPGTVKFGNAALPQTTATFSAAGVYVLQLSANDGSATTTATTTVTVNPGSASPVIVDDAGPGVTLTGQWFSSTLVPGFYGKDYLNDGNTGKGAKSVKFTPTLPSAGKYQVLAQWSAASGRATNVPYDIATASGKTTVVENQQKNGGSFVLLGTYTFNATGASVTIRNAGTTGMVCADAVEFIKVG